MVCDSVIWFPDGREQESLLNDDGLPITIKMHTGYDARPFQGLPMGAADRSRGRPEGKVEPRFLRSDQAERRPVGIGITACDSRDQPVSA